MKKIFHFTKRGKGSPSGSETASVLSVGYDLKEKDLSKVHKAAFTGDVAKLRQLVKKNDLNQLDKQNRTALHIACVHGHTEVVQYLVENKVKLNLCDNQNRSALMKAVQCQQDRCVSILLEHEADPNLVDANGNTALHLAARIPSLPVALKLLEHEANINAQNKEGNTPLILSVEENHEEMVEFLLIEGADINLKNQEKRTPLLIAACNGNICMVRLLLLYNADITVKDNKGWSSDDYAVMNGHHACSHLITEHGTKRKHLQSPSHPAIIKNKKASSLGSPEAGSPLAGPTVGKDDTGVRHQLIPSEVSENEGRSPSSQLHRAEKKNDGELEMANDSEDLTQSPNTTTKELDSVTLGSLDPSLPLDTSSRKEEQDRDEAKEREHKMRNLELQIRGLRNNMKQLEEDRNETQRLLAHEQSAQALQQDLMNLSKSIEAASQLNEASECKREIQQQVCTLQVELGSVQAELQHFRSLSRHEEGRLVALQERQEDGQHDGQLEDDQYDLKLNDETVAKTVFQDNGQLSTLKTECALLSTKLEHERRVCQQLEAEAETNKTRLQGALQETERCQAARAKAERTLRKKHQRSEEKWTSKTNLQRDTIQSLSQKLSEAESRANNLENEWHTATLSVAEKSALLEIAARECEQALARIEELEGTLQNERDWASCATSRHDAMQERLVQAESEGALLRQQLEEAQNRGTAKEQAVTDAQECFTQALNQLCASGEERVQLIEERNKELATKNAELREQNYKLEQEKADIENSLRQLQQELADSLKKLSMCEASLEVNTRYHSDLEEEKVRTQKDLDRLRGELQESEEHNIEVERRITTLMGTLDEKKQELISTGQKLQELLAATTRSEQTIKQLDEAVQRLEIEKARLEATVKEQNNCIEILQKEAQEATAVQKQSMLLHSAHDSQTPWEEELKNYSQFGFQLVKLEQEKEELSSQMELEMKKAKNLAEQKEALDARLDQEMKRNTELQKEINRLQGLVKTAKKKEQNGEELSSRQNETEAAVSRIKLKLDDLQLQLEREASRCSRLEDVNRELKEQLSSLKNLGHNNERLERRKLQLKEEVAGLRRRLEAGVMDQSQAEQFCRETEEKARQEVQKKLDEINLFLQTESVSQEVQEQIRAANEASQRAELEQRIRELEADLCQAYITQQENILQKESSRTELEIYRQLYIEELRLRKNLSAKVERSNEQLAEANAILLNEWQHTRSLLSSTKINGGLGEPVPSLGHLDLEKHTSHVEAYLTKMQSELDKNISKELDCGTSTLEGASTRIPPVGSACGSQKNLNSNLNVEQQDPVSRATQQYLEVLRKKYKV